MRTAVLLLLLVVTARCAEDIRLAEFNCFWLISSQSQARRSQTFDQAVAQVAPVIRNLDADILALIEVGGEVDVAIIRNAVNTGLQAADQYSHQAVCNSRDFTTGQHVAVLSRRPINLVTNIIPGRERYFDEADDPADSEDDTGISKGMHVTFEVANQTVNLIVAHLRSEGGEADADAQRIAQASLIRRYYLPMILRGEHVIVTGDLNDHPGQPTLQRIRGFDDIQADLTTIYLTNFWDSADGNDSFAHRWTYEFQGVRQLIDHFLLSESVIDACIGGRIDPSTSDHQGASDHRPLVLDMRWR